MNDVCLVTVDHLLKDLSTDHDNQLTLHGLHRNVEQSRVWAVRTTASLKDRNTMRHGEWAYGFHVGCDDTGYFEWRYESYL